MFVGEEEQRAAQGHGEVRSSWWHCVPDIPMTAEHILPHPPLKLPVAALGYLLPLVPLP